MTMPQLTITIVFTTMTMVMIDKKVMVAAIKNTGRETCVRRCPCRSEIPPHLRRRNSLNRGPSCHPASRTHTGLMRQCSTSTWVRLLALSVDKQLAKNARWPDAIPWRQQLTGPQKSPYPFLIHSPLSEGTWQANLASYPQRDRKWVPAKMWRCSVAGEYRQNGSFHLWISVWVAGKTVWSSLTRAIPECFRDEFLMIKHYTNLRLLYLHNIKVGSWSSVRSINVYRLCFKQPLSKQTRVSWFPWVVFLNSFETRTFRGKWHRFLSGRISFVTNVSKHSRKHKALTVAPLQDSW